MSIYTYSLIADFPINQIGTNQFHSEIQNAGFTPVLNGVEIDGDTVRVFFDSALSAPEQTSLDALVAAHIPGSDSGSIQPTSSVVNMLTLVNEVSPGRSGYDEVGRMTWDNTRYVNFREATCVYRSRILGVSTLDIQIYDSANAIELGTINSALTEYNRFSFNIPTTNTEILVRLRRSTNVGARPIMDSLSLQFIC